MTTTNTWLLRVSITTVPYCVYNRPSYRVLSTLLVRYITASSRVCYLLFLSNFLWFKVVHIHVLTITYVTWVNLCVGAFVGHVARTCKTSLTNSTTYIFKELPVHGHQWLARNIRHIKSVTIVQNRFHSLNLIII